MLFDLTFPDGGLRKEHIRAAYLAFGWDKFGHYFLKSHFMSSNECGTKLILARDIFVGEASITYPQ